MIVEMSKSLRAKRLLAEAWLDVADGTSCGFQSMGLDPWVTEAAPVVLDPVSVFFSFPPSSLSAMILDFTLRSMIRDFSKVRILVQEVLWSRPLRVTFRQGETVEGRWQPLVLLTVLKRTPSLSHLSSVT